MHLDLGNPGTESQESVLVLNGRPPFSRWACGKQEHCRSFLALFSTCSAHYRQLKHTLCINSPAFFRFYQIFVNKRKKITYKVGKIQLIFPSTFFFFLKIKLYINWCILCGVGDLETEFRLRLTDTSTLSVSHNSNSTANIFFPFWGESLCSPGYVWNSLCRPGWSQMHRNLPAVAS